MDKKAEACRLAQADQYPESAAIGALALKEEDARFRSAAAIARNIVAFSLFGANPAYCETAILNAQLTPEVYPGWEMWVFHDDTVPAHVLRRLKDKGCCLANAGEWRISHWPGTFWRFAAVLIPKARFVIFRDADSLLGRREKRLVDDWLASGKPFHVIRDWHSHVDLILAGLWGAYAPFIGDIRILTDDFIGRNALHPTHADQEFLARSIWPRIRDFALVHDSVHPGLGATPFEPASLSPEGKFALGAYLVKNFAFESDYCGPVRLILRDKSGNEICAYDGKFENNKFEIEFPYYHADKIQKGEWKFDFQFISDAVASAAGT